MAISRRFLQPINLLNAATDPASADQGDLYYNSASDKIRFYDGGQWKDVGSGGVTVSETAPANPQIGDGWFKSSTSELFFYDGTFWIEATSVVDNFLLFEVGNTPPASPMEGQGWFNNSSGEFYIYDGTYWQQITSVVESYAGFHIGTTPPSNPANGSGWFNNTIGSFYIWDGTYWQEVSTVIEVNLVNDTNPTLSADLDANGFGIDNVDHITFDTTPTSLGGPATLVWNDGEGTLDLGLKGGNVTLNIGQEEVALCYNGTGATLTKGTVVYINGAQGQRPSLAKASASSEATSSKTFGIVAESIANGAEGFVTTFGLIRGINTSAFAEGAALWLSTTAGVFGTTIPTQPDHSVFIGYCIRQHASSGEIFVKIQNGYELQELHNVLITSPQGSDVLAYDSGTSLWKNTAGYATQTYVTTAIANLVDSAPAALDTLNELAAALGDDANFATTVTNALALKAPLASPALTGTPTAPTAAADTNTTQIATTAYVVGQGYAKLSSPTFTGVPAAPTATSGTNTTQIATTAFVQTAIAGFQALPSQTGNGGKYLTTDGTTASWGEVVGGGGGIQTDVALSNSWWMGV